MKVLLICISMLLPAFTTGTANDKNPYDLLPLNHVQVIGSHNSYKKAINPDIMEFLKKQNPSAAYTLDYSHIDLKDQLDLGLLNLEIDVHADSKGGAYSHPYGLNLLKDSDPEKHNYDPEGVLNKPGFKVFHVQGIDFRSDCLTFDLCLSELKIWSDAHKDHLPVFVTINAKDEDSPLPDTSAPEKFTSDIFDQLDNALVSGLGKEKLIIPEDIKGDFPSLRGAVLDGNWPMIKYARGKFIFILDENNEKRTAYIEGHASLAGRKMFVNADPDTPEAAILIMNHPKEDLNDIQKMVRKGFIVRTRADDGTTEARNNDMSSFEAAKKSGAQIISTDYYYPSSSFKSDFKINFKDNTYIRANPVFKKKKN